MIGKELNMDSTPKHPYRHPNFGQVTTLVPMQQGVGTTTNQHPASHHPTNKDDDQEGAAHRGTMMNNRQRAPTAPPIEPRRGLPAVKPAKMNILEFEGLDVNSWIQTIEIYFDSARTPLEQLAVMYLKDYVI
jgi:hypothetical protein